MKRVLFIALVGISCLAVFAFAEEAKAPDDLLQTLNAQIEKAKTQLDKKQEQEKSEKESEVRRNIKKEARKKYIDSLYNEASSYLRRKIYSQAKEIYERLLILDPQAKQEIEKKINFCSERLRISEEKQSQELARKDKLQQLSLARQLAENLEKKEIQEKGKALSSRTSEIRQHLSLGNEYFENKNYLEAAEEFEKVLSIQPNHKEAITKLAKAKTLLVKGSESSYKATVSMKERMARYNQLIKDGFKEAQKSLEANDYNNAQEAFARVLDSINNLSIESVQSKTARQIKEGAHRGPEEIFSYIRSDRYEEAKKKLWELIQKTATLAREREDKEKRDKSRLLIESYLKSASEYLEKNDYQKAKVELQKAASLDPENLEANTLLDRLEDIIAITKEAK